MSDIPVDVSSAAATLQSAMNELITVAGSADEISGDYLLRIAQVQAILEISTQIRDIRTRMWPETA